MNDALKQAIVFAAGKGMRMRPLTLTTPKPLIEVGGKAMLDWALDQLAKVGVTHTVVNASYLAQQIIDHVAPRQNPQVIISLEEGEPLETGGGIVHAFGHLKNSPFFAMNSDVICLDGATPMLTRLQQAWIPEKMDMLLLLCPTEKARGYHGVGDFFLEQDGALRMRRDEPRAPYVFTGSQILSPHLFENPPAEIFSLNLFYRALSYPETPMPRAYGLVHDGEWLHVGDVEALAQANEFFKNHTS